MPRVRLTVWRMMVLVAIVALALGVEKLRRSSQEFRRLAGYHAAEEGFYLSHARLWDQGENGGCMGLRQDATPEDYARAARWARLWAVFESGLRRKYESAAARPWLRVTPDPRRPAGMDAASGP